MSAELSIGAFVSKFWGAIVAAGAFVFSHIRLNQKVEYQADRLNTLERGVAKSFDEFKDELKEIRKEVTDTNKSLHDIHIKLLESLNKN